MRWVLSTLISIIFVLPSFADTPGPPVCEIDGGEYRFGWGSLQRFVSENRDVQEALGFDALNGDCRRALTAFEAKVLEPADPPLIRPELEPDMLTGNEILRRLEGGDVTIQVQGGRPSNFMPSVYIAVQDNNAGTTCGGVLVNENWLMTSAHCIPGGIEPRVRSVNFMVLVESLNGAELVCLTDEGRGPVARDDRPLPCPGLRTGRAHIHDDYDGGQYGRLDDEDDLALIQFGPGWREARGAPLRFAAFERYGVDEDDWITLSGYSLGFPSRSTGDGLFALIDRRRGVFKVDDVDSRDIEFDNRETTRVCRGDSGSPLYYRVGAANLVVGLMSQGEIEGDDFCAEDGQGAQATRIWAPKEAWIERTLGRQCRECGRVASCFATSGGGGCGGGGGGGGGGPSCPANQQCCAAAPTGECIVCVPRGVECQIQ